MLLRDGTNYFFLSNSQLGVFREMTHLACRVQHSKTAEVMPFRREPPADAAADAPVDAPADAAADAPEDAPAEPPAEEYKDEEIVDCVRSDRCAYAP